MQKVPSDELVGFRDVSMLQTPASTDSLFHFPERCDFYIYAFISFGKLGKTFFHKYFSVLAGKKCCTLMNVSDMPLNSLF